MNFWRFEKVSSEAYLRDQYLVQYSVISEQFFSPIFREALSVIEDIQGVLTELEQENIIAPINIELMDNEMARVFMNSRKAEVSEILEVFGQT